MQKNRSWMATVWVPLEKDAAAELDMDRRVNFGLGMYEVQFLPLWGRFTLLEGVQQFIPFLLMCEVVVQIFTLVRLMTHLWQGFGHGGGSLWEWTLLIICGAPVYLLNVRQNLLLFAHRLSFSLPSCILKREIVTFLFTRVFFPSWMSIAGRHTFSFRSKPSRAKQRWCGLDCNSKSDWLWRIHIRVTYSLLMYMIFLWTSITVKEKGFLPFQNVIVLGRAVTTFFQPVFYRSGWGKPAFKLPNCPRFRGCWNFVEILRQLGGINTGLPHPLYCCKSGLEQWRNMHDEYVYCVWQVLLFRS